MYFVDVILVNIIVINFYMDNLDNIIAAYKAVCMKYDLINQSIVDTDTRMKKYIEVCNNTSHKLEAASSEFRTLTSIINKKDIPFFVFAVLLQGGYRYLIKKMRDMDDQEIAKKTPFHREEHSNRLGNRYYISKEEILNNPVPFDAFQKMSTNDWYKRYKIPIPGFSGFNHRYTALGHDPLLGLIFGTANIMTSTITRNDFISWHVDTVEHERKKKTGESYVINLDTICERASTIEIFRVIKSRLEEEGTDAWILLGMALFKEIVHLFSDLPGKQSLPIPIISSFSPKLAHELSLYGINTGTIVQGAFATKVINWGIAFLHRLTKSEDENEKLFEVRTQKILMYSNLLATTSDIVVTLFSAYEGDKNAMRKFDLGGYLVTLNQLCHSTNVIVSIEREFYVNKIIKEIQLCNRK